MEKPIKYLEHPVDEKTKREVIAQGFRIVDARFAPDDVQPKVARTPAQFEKELEQEEKHGENKSTLKEIAGD